MNTTKSNVRFTINFFEQTITGTKASFSKAGKGFGPEYEELTSKMAAHPGFAKIELLNEYEAMIEELKTEAEAVRDSIKAEMMERETEELIAGSYIIRWTSVLSNRFDSTAFKKVYGDLYKAFTKQSASRRFSISC